MQVDLAAPVWLEALVGQPVDTSTDERWLTASALVLLAVVGVACMVEGLTRERIVTSFQARWPIQVAGAVLGFAVCGYAVAFAPGREWFGTEWFALSGIDMGSAIDFSGRSPSHGARLVLHSTVATVVAVLSLGAMAERATLATHALVSFSIGALVYPVLVRSVWGPGLVGELSLGSARFVDQGAGAVVFLAAGMIGLVGTIMVGPRLGKYGSSGQPRVVPGRSLPLASVGALLIVVGWLGASGGLITGSAVPPAAAGARTLLAASGGALAASLVSYRRSGQVGDVSALRGLLAGVAGIAAGVQSIDPAWAVLVGLVAGALAVLVGALLDRAKVDDPIGVVAVAGVGGIVGVVAVGLFDASSLDDLLVQLLGGSIVLGWSIVSSAAVFSLLRVFGMLRVSEDTELVGLGVDDLGRHDD